MSPALRATLLAGSIAMQGDPSGAGPTYEILEFQDLDGWEADDHATALGVFLNTCDGLVAPEWQSLCAMARLQPPDAARAFFERAFRPVLVRDGSAPMFTGYFEPELNGSRVASDRFRYPLYAMPPEARETNPWLSRRDIVTSGVMANRGLEIAWVDDPVELFFLQIQGSGRIRLPDGRTLRVGYGGKNGQPYRSIGAELVRRGVHDAQKISAQAIKAWLRRNPEAGQDLLFHNASYVFFRELRDLAPESGPLGAMDRSVTPRRSIAVDPAITPMGAPVWLEKDGPAPMRRLMVAQDTGSAIKGAQRADIFFGTGDAAGLEAGRLHDPGRMVVLLPVQHAEALLTGGL